MSKRVGRTRHETRIIFLLMMIAQCIITATAVSSPTHNSDQFACSLPGFTTEQTCTDNGGVWNPSQKWPAGWGITGGEYGEFKCNTCHMKNPPNNNIKRVRSEIVAPEGSFPGGSPVVIQQLSDMGDDSDNHTDSERVCEVCHSRTSYHRFDTTAQPGGSDHFNLSDCIRCHRHDDGFRPDCTSCHGNSIAGTSWPDGNIANNVTDIYEWADDEAGSHLTHVSAIGTGNYSCDNCHPGLPPLGHYDDDTSGVEQGEVIRMDADNDGNAEYWEYLDGPTATSGTAVYFKDETGSDDTDAYYRFDNSIYNSTCYNIDCHGGAELQWGETNGCLICHSVEQGSRVAVVDQFSANSHHVQEITLTTKHCYQCHWEANSDGTINPAYHGGIFNPAADVDLVIYAAGSRPTNYTINTTALRYTADGSRTEIESLNAHCLGCHSEQNSSAEPFGDGKTPQEYAWDRNEVIDDGVNDHLIVDADGTSIASRYSQSTSTSWGKYTGVANAAKKNLQKAFSAHGNAGDNAGGWSSSTGVDGSIINSRANDSPGTDLIACFDCHNSHGSTVSAKTTSYNSATTFGGILKDTQSGYGGFSISYKPTIGGSSAEKNEFNSGAALCFDCHLNASGGSSFPWGYEETFGASQRILGYTDPPYFKSTGAGNQTRYAYKNNLNNKGGHFGVSSTMDNTPMGTIGGLCTPCHDPHGVTPNLGSNQQFSVPLLKGTWLTSPYREDVTPSNNEPTTGLPDNTDRHIYLDQNTFGTNIKNFNQLVTGITQNENQFAGLCLGCHPKNSLTKDGSGSPNAWFSKDRIHEAVKGWKTSTGTVKHRFSCSKCHTPHSSGQPRLMVTNCMDRSHKGRVTWRSNPQFYGVNVWEAICNEGEGRIPGDFWYSEWCVSTPSNPNPNFPPPLPSYSNISCHESYNADRVDKDGSGNPITGTVQSWNRLTNWGEPALTLNTLSADNCSPSATSGEVDCNITWSSNLPSNSRLDYGLTAGYGQTASDTAMSTIHSIGMNGLTNHQTYYVQASSTSFQLQSASTAGSFYIAVPPSVPVLTELSAFECVSPGTSPDCDLTLDWAASTDPGGDPVEYEVQISTDSGFASPVSSGWITSTSWTTTLNATNTTHYWRVRARNQYHQATVSAWANSNIIVSDGTPPEVVLVEPEVDYAGWTCEKHYDTSELSQSIQDQIYWTQGPLEFSWEVKGGTPQASAYEVEIYRSPYTLGSPFMVMPWTNTFSWATDIINSTGGFYETHDYYWRVRGRDVLDNSQGPWSDLRHFSLQDDYCI